MRLSRSSAVCELLSKHLRSGDKNFLQMCWSIGQSGLVCQERHRHNMLSSTGLGWTGAAWDARSRDGRKTEDAPSSVRYGVLRVGGTGITLPGRGSISDSGSEIRKVCRVDIKRVIGKGNLRLPGPDRSPIPHLKSPILDSAGPIPHEEKPVAPWRAE